MKWCPEALIDLFCRTSVCIQICACESFRTTFASRARCSTESDHPCSRCLLPSSPSRRTGRPGRRRTDRSTCIIIAYALLSPRLHLLFKASKSLSSSQERLGPKPTDYRSIHPPCLRFPSPRLRSSRSSWRAWASVCTSLPS